MGGWYTIGLCLGVGFGLGVVLAGFLAATPLGASLAAVAGAGLGAILGLLVGEAPETIAGGTTGFLGAVSGAAVALGGFRRGATRLGVAVFLCLAGLLVSVLALIPLVGYLEAVTLPLVAARLRARRPARFAGLRTLAK